MSQRKILQLTSPLDRFQEFDKKVDSVLLSLDDLGKLYTDLGFTEADIKDMTVHKKEQFREELMQHGQMCLAMINHPLLHVLKNAREKARVAGDDLDLYKTPTGIWQHYKGAYYAMIGACKSTDHHCDAVMYREFGKDDGEIYTITLFNFYSKKELAGQQVSRFVKIRD